MIFSRFAPLAISHLLLGVSIPAYAGETKVSVANGDGGIASISQSSIVLTPIYKGALYSELKAKEESHRLIGLQYDDCLKGMDAFHCWQMYGSDVSASKRVIPGAMLRLAFDPLYVIVTYKPVVTDVTGKKKAGDEAFVVCLNPKVPAGYWDSINQYKPILKYVPSAKSGPDLRPLDLLKTKACIAFAKYDR